MSIDFELLITARNYAVKAEQELLKAQKHWKERFEAIDDELQGLYRDKAELTEAFNKLHHEYQDFQQQFSDTLGNRHETIRMGTNHTCR